MRKGADKKGRMSKDSEAKIAPVTTRVSGWKLVTIVGKLVYFTYLRDEINLLI